MKRIYFFVLLTILALHAGFALLLLNRTHGWDAGIYCKAAEVSQNGLNPYLVDQLGTEITWNYPPIFLKFFELVCAPPLNFAVYYPAYYLVILIICVFLWLPDRDGLFAFTLASCAFIGFAWNLQTGNVGVLELMLLSLAFLFLSRKNWSWASLMIGLMASIKLVSILYLPLIFFAPTNKKSILRAFAVGLLGFILPTVVSFVFYPDSTSWYLRQVAGLIPGQHTPILDRGTWSNQVLAYFVMRLFSLGNQVFTLLVVTGVVALIEALLGVFIWRSVIRHVEPEQRFHFVYGLAFLSVTLLLPHMKPYSFILVTPALFWLFRMAEYRERIILLTFCAFVPLAVHIARRWLPDTNLVQILWDYNLMLNLLMTMLAVIALQSKSLRTTRLITTGYARTPRS